MWNKGEYIGHLEPATTDIEDEKTTLHANPYAQMLNSVTIQWMMAE